MFNKKFYGRLASEFHKVHPDFHPAKFVKEVTIGLDDMALNQRMRNTTNTLRNHLPADYKRSVEIICRVVPEFKSHYTSFLFPDFIAVFGKEDFALSLETLKYLTQFGSSEFAIREFLRLDFDKTIKKMYKWAEDDNFHVRRLASEGCRPRLPWSFNLERVMNDPELTKPILETLKTDSVLYVKKSVANHLNDFSRIHTEWMLNTVRSWDKTNKDTAWIIKHASRTLIKKGHPESLAIFDFEKNVKIKLDAIKLEKNKLRLGDMLSFSFDISSLKSTSQKLVIDYKIHYCKNSGELFPKVFKLKEVVIKPKQSLKISKLHSFKDLSTRKHYSGKHAIEIMVNGKSFSQKEFILTV
ncbi:MAG: DNA alkylation repair protein [Bacteroidota bacterium]|nr:DNA alkylation repair protein [Bacteroidota bacterium]